MMNELLVRADGCPRTSPFHCEALPRRRRARFAGRPAVLALACLLLPAVASSQTLEERAIRQAEQIQRLQQERLEREREEALQRRPPTRLEAPVPQLPEPRPEGACFEAREIILEGATLLEDAARAELLAPYLGECLGVGEIERLMSEITRHYFELGYIGVRVYVPQQDMSGGRLRLLVVEGRVEGIRVDDDGAGSVSIANVFPGMVGRPLNLRDIEQGLDQINRLASNNASMALEPGSEPGDTLVVVSNRPGKPWHLHLSGDNYGSKMTGREQAGLSLSVDDPLGFNDLLSLTWRRSVTGDRSEEFSESKSLLYSVPFGYLTAYFSTTHSDYVSTLATPGGFELESEGRSRYDNLMLDWVVRRDQRTHAALSASLTRKKTRNYLADQLLAVSSRTLTVLDLDLRVRIHGVAGGLATISGGLAFGLSTLGALRDESGLPDWAPRAQFEKFKFSASWLRPLDETGRLTWSSQLYAQLSADALYGSEQISIGSPYSVRGFLDESLSSDHGVYLRNELRANYATSLLGRHVSLSPYFGLDYGRVHPYAAGGVRGELAGAAVGLTAYIDNLMVDAMLMAPLIKPDSFDDEDGAALLRLSMNF